MYKEKNIMKNLEMEKKKGDISTTKNRKRNFLFL